MRVSVKTNVKSDFQEILQTLESLLAKVEGLSNIGAKIAIKPNLCSSKPPETGATTDVKIVDALIKLIKENEPTAQIYVVESDTASRSAWEVFKVLGYRKLERKYKGVKLVNLSECVVKKVRVENGHFFRVLHAPKILLDCDMILSVGKLKTHTLEKMTCTLKNLFGLLPERRKHLYHPFLPEVLYDIVSVFNPKLSIVDGIYAMEGRGPTKGTARKTGILIVGNNPIATDIVAARIMGFDPMDVPHLRYAMENSGILEKEVEVIGEIKELSFQSPPKLSFLLERFISCSLRKYEYASKFKLPYRLVRKGLHKIRKIFGV